MRWCSIHALTAQIIARYNLAQVPTTTQWNHCLLFIVYTILPISSSSFSRVGFKFLRSVINYYYILWSHQKLLLVWFLALLFQPKIDNTLLASRCLKFEMDLCNLRSTLVTTGVIACLAVFLRFWHKWHTAQWYHSPFKVAFKLFKKSILN